MTQVTEAIAYAHQERGRFVSELKDLLAIPSISTLSAHKPDMQRAAEWLAANMRGMGLEHVEILPTAGHPVVVADWLHAAGRPTMLIYGHYDVQPVDPLNEWHTEPFTPTERGDNLYARGASDMKGQVMAFLKAIEALLQTGGLPLNVEIMIEGEEEIGSPNLEPFMRQQAAKLKCDFSLNADSGIISPTLPSIAYGLRGLAYFELWVHGPDHDLHSGVFGGSVHNPAQALAELIAGMHDGNGRVTLPGFYDKVRTLGVEERGELARSPITDAAWQAMTGAPQLYGEAGYTTVERTGARPTLEINGLLSGFTGEGSKTVLPAKAMAKISMRLIPDQDDKEVEAQLRAYLAAKAPPTIRWELKSLTSGPAVIVSRDTPAMQAAIKALEATFGVKPVMRLEGGSVPVVSMVQKGLGVDSILMGFGLPDDNLHAPNEKLHLPNYYKGIDAYIRYFDEVARLS
ncbi:MAG: dipeptidase [Anaerolineales bacterium]|nr:dipeptidase [Anaerolineales bacterium]